MQVSVIISTYNAPDWLEKVLWGFSVQTHQDFELLVADDGSTAETAHRIDRLRAATYMQIRHIWHEDRGFRKCTILNRALDAAASQYVVVTDGDFIPRRDFVATHVRHSAPNQMLSGGALRLPMELSHKITKADILAGRATDPRWLIANGLGWNKKLPLLTRGSRLATFLDLITTTRATWNGLNASAAKSDLVRANGFDERMQYGGLDRELGERLMNAGLSTRQIRHRAVGVHLDHARDYVNEQALRRNRSIRAHTRRQKIVRTLYGIKKYALPPEARAA